ncbi:MAG: nicotinate-nucleotide diphosphorylase (carboxylating) [Deltaproteobacteria bacterium CG11_big_fil_rev_8_21_14_0_20_47_16]|nr:MAG: nicotinate-nucleotide diphosphorylase (carboxylating) [Deltaproteobacteria bacterium CG11_big_fil_rev_8_21_14_0_20_47_16]
MSNDRDITVKMQAKRHVTASRTAIKSPLATLIQMALAEDIGSGDVTTKAIVDPKLQARAIIESQSPLVLCGMDVARKVAHTVDARLTWKAFKKDGDFCEAEEPLAELSGNASSLLVAERTMLNFLQHLSGIATQTHKYADAIKHTKAKVTDTRKTIPGYRELAKAAVLAGGGVNHRMGLYDRYLVKNNHIDMAESVPDALESIRMHGKPGIMLEVECRDFDELEEAIEFGAKMVLLDNFPIDDVRKAIRLVAGRVLVEVSGGITLDNIVSYAESGPNFIAVGALTHSAPAVPIHMLIEPIS